MVLCLRHATVEMEPVIHIHEDDWGMRSLYPIEAMPEVDADLQEAIAAAERNRVPDGFGWTDIHQIEAPQKDYAQAGLRLSDASDALQAIMPRVSRFNATATAGFEPDVHDAWGSYEEGAYCYGYGASCFIKLETDGGLVQQIWFEGHEPETVHIQALRLAIEAIDRIIESMIVDYWQDCAGRVRDPEFFNRYVSLLAGNVR
ncbi:MAG TPA: hypothetical protein VKN63_11950 [Afifellaceae bacterium]|nr:hypothetical protein [Afifellaceae bacterium]